MDRKSLFLFWLVFLLLTSCNHQLGGAPDSPNSPIIIPNARIGSCILSPHASYVHVEMSLDGTYQFYKLTSNPAEQMSFTFPELQAESGFWFDDQRWFLFNSDRHSSLTLTDVADFNQAWLLDMVTGAITDVFTLPLSTHTIILSQALNLNQTYDQRMQDSQISPNKEYFVSGDTIYRYHGSVTDIREPLNSFNTPQGAEACRFPWKPDSSGAYILEDQQFNQRHNGFLRYLSVIPVK